MKAEQKKKIQKWILIIITIMVAIGMLLPFLWNPR